MSVSNAFAVRWGGTAGATYYVAIQRLLDDLYWDFGAGATFSATPGTKFQALAESPANSGRFTLDVAAPLPGFVNTQLSPLPSGWCPVEYAVEVWDSTQTGLQGLLTLTINPSGNSLPVWASGGSGGSVTDNSVQADVQAALTAQGYTTARAAKLDNLDINVGSRLPTTGYTAPPTDYQQRGVAVTLPDPAPAGYGGTGGGSTLTDASIQNDVTLSLQNMGFTNTRVINLDKLDAPVSGCSTPGSLQNINLSQPLVDTRSATVGGALDGAWTSAFGLAVRDRTNKLLKLFGFSSQVTPLVTFSLDDADAPTTRTPQ